MMQRVHFWWLSTLSTITFAAQANENSSTAKTLTTSPVTSAALLETVLGLGLVLGIIAILAWLIKRTGRFQTTANGEIKMIAGLSLGPRERAVLLEVGGDKILVGVTAHQIQTLHVLGKTTTTSPPQQQDKYGQFDHQLRHILKQEHTDD